MKSWSLRAQWYKYVAVHDEGYVMRTTNLKLDVKKQEFDMALDDETRILKQSFCALIYGLTILFQ